MSRLLYREKELGSRLKNALHICLEAWATRAMMGEYRAVFLAPAILCLVHGVLRRLSYRILVKW